MLVTESGMVMLVRLWQFRKAPRPMLVTLSGIDTLVRMWQLVTLFGIVTHSANALSPMLFTLFGIVMLVTSDLQP